MGGVTPTAKTTIDRIDYSNDTATASLRGPLDTNNAYNATILVLVGYVTVGPSPGSSKKSVLIIQMILQMHHQKVH